jgi:hypothetical protein
VKDKLTKSSTNSAQRAIRHYLSEDYDQFLIHAAMSFEQLGKARLATIHPSLIIDKDFDSFLHACGAGKHAKRLPWNIKTINATEVLARCTQLQPQLNDFSARLKLLTEFRNSATHLGEIVDTERKEIFHAFIASTSLVADEMGIPRREFFGEYAELVATQLDKSAKEVNRLVAERIARAKTNYQQKYGTLDRVHLESIVKSIESSYVRFRYEDELVACPACGHNGLVNGSFDVDWEVDYDRDGTPEGGYPVVILTPTDFTCNVCGLSLANTSELKAAGLGERLQIEDVDPTDFFGEPDY